jgi:hypothetical protein
VTEGDKMVRAKFQVTAVTEFAWSTAHKEVTFAPRYDASIPEDQRCASETPSGKLIMIINNPEALEQFQVGKTFYLDFTPVEEAVSSM